MADKTLDKLDARMAKLRDQKEAIQSELRELSEEREALLAKESAAIKLLAMSAAEREALGIQTVNGVGGIQSEESVHG